MTCATSVGLALVCACASSRGGGGGDDLDAGEELPVDAAVGGGDGFPRGAISFFLGALCPTGWAPYADAVGRTIVPVAASGDAGMMVGTPLGVNETRAHHHDLAVSVNLPSVSYAGIAGESNHGVSRSGQVDGLAATADAAPDVPYAQLRVCRKSAEPGERAAPSGVIAFFAGACPPAWNPAPPAIAGRYLVALPAGGTAGRTFGGDPLTSGELRAHTHTVSGSVAAPSHGIALAGGCCAGGYGGAGTHAATITAGPAPVEMPYLQLSACVAP
ncbi:MAG TPA: hypothetical protein VM261_04340 [Kofleriaceae bacterium]|nr:hypothetical protein [Kofleriaceae bacterium]